MTQVSSGSTLFDQSRSFDASGNVLTTNTTLPTGTDNQAFCYDNLNRLTWAGATGTPPCQSLTAGTLTSARYQQSDAYDVLDRLTTGPAGSGYTYGDTSHLDAVTSTAGGYTASYDATGDMTSRAPTTSLTWTGTPTGQTMTYDAMRRLLSWQNTASSPTSTASYAYDGEGKRVGSRRRAVAPRRPRRMWVRMKRSQPLAQRQTRSSIIKRGRHGSIREWDTLISGQRYAGQCHRGVIEHGECPGERVVLAVWRRAVHEWDDANQLWLHRATAGSQWLDVFPCAVL